MPDTAFQKRARSRARRLGMDPKRRYTREEAQSLRTRLRNRREGTSTGSGGAQAPSSGNSTVNLPPPSVPKSKLKDVVTQPGLRTNTVQSGAGSQRKGKQYRVRQDADGNFYHVYGRGKKAKRVRIRDATASLYGYKKSS